MQIIKPPSKELPKFKRTLFLAGSIDQGKAGDWQKRVENELKNFDITIYNPRRDDWDDSWEENIKNPNFFEQVNWELEKLESCGIILMYFEPNSKSPISLLEFGLFAKNAKLIVCCPEGFWKKGNVDIVCQKYGIPLFDNLTSTLIKLKSIWNLN